MHFVAGLDAARAGEWPAAGAQAHRPPAAVPLAGRLPCLSLAFLSDTLAVAAGFDCAPLLLARTRQGWQLAGEVTAAEEAQQSDKKSAVRARLLRRALPRHADSSCCVVFGAPGVLQVAD